MNNEGNSLHSCNQMPDTPDMSTEQDAKKKRKIPESLRQQLSEAGKKRAAALTKEQRSLGGKRAWEARIAKALKQERQQKQQAAQAVPVPGEAA